MLKSDKSPLQGVYRYTVNKESSGLRLDQYLASVSVDIPLSFARCIVDVGGVHLSGRRTTCCSQLVSFGDSLEVFIDHQSATSQTHEEIQILYRDQDLIVLNKPAGMATQPTPARYHGTVYAELQRLLRGQGHQYQQPSIGMVQRLDQGTSGVMIFSIHKRSHKKLTESFLARSIDKSYLALVSGVVPEESGCFISQLARRRRTNLMVSVEKGGKLAETRYHLLQTVKQVSLVEVQLITGRSHQIRAHFSEAGCPLLGDTSYGGLPMVDCVNIPRQMLHSRTLSFCHPVTGKRMSFTAPLPNDFSAILQHVGVSLNANDV